MYGAEMRRPPHAVSLGTPVGSAEYIASHAQGRMTEEMRLLDQLPQLPDLQSAWLLLRYCASPRANHLLRSVPPHQLEEYIDRHDTAIWATLRQLLGVGSLRDADMEFARAVSSLPGRMGGLGLQLASRTAPAAYWAAWADALPLLRARRPRETSRILQAFGEGSSPHPSLGALAASGRGSGNP